MNTKLKTLTAVCVIMSQLVFGYSAAKAQPDNFKWTKTDHSVALINTEKIVWQFNYQKDQSRPYFHPVALPDGTVLTENSPSDHIWHHALWFAWKGINGVNFWEEDPQTRQGEGRISWKNVKVITGKDHSAQITMELAYNHRGQKPILTEKLTLIISPPNANGQYSIDWSSKFKACSEKDVSFERTPIPGEQDGKSWGGYAGLSVRLNGKGNNWKVCTEKGPVNMPDGTSRGKAKSMDYSAVINNRPAGIAILDHPGNLNAPTPWYAINNQMKYFSPAVICFKQHTLGAGDTLKLNYRIIIHPNKWDAGKLKTQIKKYISSK